MCNTLSSLQPGPGVGCFLWLHSTGANGFFMTAIKVIKFLSGREDKAEERKELKGGTEERQKAGGVRCCCTTQQITQERV